MWLMLVILLRFIFYLVVYWEFFDIVYWLVNGNWLEYRLFIVFLLLKLKFLVWKGCCCYVGLFNVKFFIKIIIIVFIIFYILWLENININYLFIRIFDNIVINEKIIILNIWINFKYYILIK